MVLFWRAALIAFLVLLFLRPGPITAQQSQPSSATTQRDGPSQQYSLPPDKLEQAIAYSRARNWLHFANELYGLAILLAILVLGLAAKFRDWAEAASTRRLVQAMIFVPLLLLANDILGLPLEIYGQHLELVYQQSVQSWLSWLWDWTKSELLGLVLAVILVYLLYAVIRRSPRRWWFYFWLASLPILFAIIFLTPLVIEPLFYQFEPLSKKHPDLVNELEKVVARGGLAIPPERMFEMKASEKVTSLNAYVTGLGVSKRVVVWDTTIAKTTTPELLFIFGHEMGHYVLNHIRDSLILSCFFGLALLYASYHALRWMLRRWGSGWKIRDIADWASLPALMLFASVIGFLAEPVVNGYSRHIEHQADIYGLEVIHGLVPESNLVAAHAFQVLGEVGLDEPNPNRFIEFWIYNHPSISERVTFAASYNPWPSGTEKYVK